jgi:hypothetical protein
MEFPISSNRVAYYLNIIYDTSIHVKGSPVKCVDIANILISNEDKEVKKIFFTEVLDMCNSKDFYDFFKGNSNKGELKKLIDEILAEIKSGEAQRKEEEFEQIFRKIENRKKIIGDI